MPLPLAAPTPPTCDAGLPVDVLERHQLVEVHGQVGDIGRRRRTPGAVTLLAALPLVDRVPLVEARRRVHRSVHRLLLTVEWRGGGLLQEQTEG